MEFQSLSRTQIKFSPTLADASTLKAMNTAGVVQAAEAFKLT